MTDWAILVPVLVYLIFVFSIGFTRKGLVESARSFWRYFIGSRSFGGFVLP